MSSEDPDDDLIFGRNSVFAFLSQSLKAGEDDGFEGRTANVHKIFLSDAARPDGRIDAIKRMARQLKVPVTIVERRKLDRMLTDYPEEDQNHQGVVAMISQVAALELSEFIAQLKSESKAVALEGAQEAKAERKLVVVLDGIEDPHNLGAIIRVAEAAGAKGLLLPARRSAGVTGAVAKASAGALASLPIVRIQNIVRALEELKGAGFWVAGLDEDAYQHHFEADLVLPLALVIGNEGHGLSRLVKEHCDLLLRIPMLGRTESLNASVAAGVVLYEFVRQNFPKRGGRKGQEPGLRVEK
jgi:23S rRNA (guanosine2251-2'-O)-methyltransferase